MATEQDLTAAAAELEQALGVDKALAAPDLCKTYLKAKPWIEKIVKVLDKLPLPWAGTLAKVLKLLMEIADKFCPA